ncbi:FAD-dependent oxidoreductase [Clostridium sp.]|jgi:pyridine nucleotide-disulfide oxidoreductase family protein|uniref:FAD-dependent oxidoreductase n=1 Tax=Clostridium sp. TaxID=1506 RepID=UPI003EEBFE6C
MQKPKRLLLVGGGHAHVFLIKQFYLKNIPGLEVVLVTPGQYQYYSGMAAGYVEGIYKEEDMSFDLKKMCQKSRVKYIKGRITGIDAKNRCVKLENHEIVSFDVISVDTGSEMAGKNVQGVVEYAYCVKPLENLFKLRENFIAQMFEESQVVIVGAGAAGIEMAFALKSLSCKMKINVEIILAHSGNSILKGYNENVREKTLKKLEKDKIKILSQSKISSVSEINLFIESGEQIKYDFLVWAAGPKSNPMYKASGFTVDKGGYMVVNRYLQSVDYPFIFGAGDCISFCDFEYVKKVGVYATREAPYLINNILKFIDNEGLKEYIPQVDYLAIISAGNKKGIMQYKGMANMGRLSWKLKDYIDRVFMEKFKY